MKFNLIQTLVLFLLLASCGPSEPQKAVNKLNLAESLLAAGDSATALKQLDSIPKLYPKAKVEVRKAIQLNNQVIVAMMMEKRSRLQEVRSVIDSLAPGFVAEKGEFDRFTSFYPSTQHAQGNWSKSFLKAWLNEKGELYLSSNYYGGNWLAHYRIRIYNQDLQIKSDSVPVGDPYHYQSEFNGMKWERITFRPGQSEELIKFIYENGSLPLKAVFLGKQHQAIILEERDKDVIGQVYRYAAAIRARVGLEKEITALQSMVKPDQQ